MWWIFILYILPGIIAAFNEYIIKGLDSDVFCYSIAPVINIIFAFVTIDILINCKLKPEAEQRLNDIKNNVILILPIALLLLIFTL